MHGDWIGSGGTLLLYCSCGCGAMVVVVGVVDAIGGIPIPKIPDGSGDG